MQQSCQQCGKPLPSDGQQPSSPLPTDKVLFADCASLLKSSNDVGECLNCRQQLEIVRFNTVEDVFMYLKRENLYKPEFEEIESMYRNVNMEIEKKISKTCLIQIMTKGGINSLLTKLNITAQKESNEEPKVVIETNEQNQNENKINNKEQNQVGYQETKSMTDIPVNQYNNTLMNSNNDINLNTNSLNNMNQNFYNQMQYQPTMQNTNGYSQYQMNNNMNYYNNPLMSYYNYFQNQDTMNNQNMNISNFPSQFNDNKLKTGKEIGPTPNMGMMLQQNQFNPQFNMMKQNFANPMNMMTNQNPMIFDSQKEMNNLNMDDLQKQINTMKECNKIQRNYLTQLYALIGKFDEQVKQIQKNYYSFVPPSGYQQNLI